jgi:Tol biopolymer transport system component/DNA-binding winged helix-turn-helix (wHTH) protein
MLFSFDNYTLNSQERTLKRQDDTIALTPKVFETLLVLVENRDHIVSKEELLTSIWPEHFVEESNLTQNVSVLRKALGESANGKKYIATFSGRGYRFVEPVLVAEQPPVQACSPATTSISNRASAHASSRPAARSDASTHCTAPGHAGEPPQATPASAAMPASEPDLSYGWRRPAYIGICAALILAASVFIFKRLQEHRVQPPTPANTAAVMMQTGTIRTLVRMEGAQYQPDWSRDGKQLAFVYAGPNGSDSAIYIQTIGQMHPHRISSGAGRYSSPVFSPDSRSLAFLDFRRDTSEILLYDLATGKTRRLTTLLPHRYGLSCRQLDWSPSGEFLVVNDKDAQSDPLSLYLVFLSNGTKVHLTYPDMDIIGDTAPRFSPDGRQIAFIRMKYQYEYDVFVVAVNGGKVRRLTTRSGILADVDWRTDHHVIYTADQDGEFRMWQIDLQTANPRPALVSSIATDMPLQLSILPKMRKLAFSGYCPDLNVWAYTLNKPSSSAADWKPIIRTPGQDITPAFSPDGKRIAFRSDVSGRFQIWVSRADGSNAVPVPTGSLFPSVISWAPDSQSIIFSSSSAPGIYQVSLSANFPLRKISGISMSHPLYSVDGKWIFADSGGFLYRLPVAGGPAELITYQGGTPIRQSADGRYVYFGHQRMGTTISRYDLLTHQQKIVVSSLIPGYHDAWALTRGGIVFLTQQEGKPVIEFHDLTTGANRTIGAFPGPLPMIATSGFSVSPDGKTLLVVRSDPASANIETVAITHQEYTLASASGGR